MITELVVDRKTWMRGGYENFQTELLNTRKKEWDGEQYMCCLGQLCLAMGMTEEDIMERLGPRSIDPRVQGMDWWDDKYDFTEAAMGTNDAKHLSDSEREAEEIRLFQDVGLAMSFT